MSSVCRALKLAFPGRVDVSGGCATVALLPDATATVSRDGEVVVWDAHGTDYTVMLAEAREEAGGAPSGPAEVLVALQRAMERTAGFVPLSTSDVGYADLEEYDPATDTLLLALRPSVQTTRPLSITTYGTRFVFEAPEGTQRVYDASGLRGERNKFTARLRGTDRRLQHTVRVIPQFDGFVRDIVEDIERNGWSAVAVTCRAGHHRSVAVAEWLAQLYPNTRVTHMTIDK